MLPIGIVSDRQDRVLPDPVDQCNLLELLLELRKSILSTKVSNSLTLAS